MCAYIYGCQSCSFTSPNSVQGGTHICVVAAGCWLHGLLASTGGQRGVAAESACVHGGCMCGMEWAAVLRPLPGLLVLAGYQDRCQPCCSTAAVLAGGGTVPVTDSPCRLVQLPQTDGVWLWLCVVCVLLQPVVTRKLRLLPWRCARRQRSQPLCWTASLQHPPKTWIRRPSLSSSG